MPKCNNSIIDINQPLPTSFLSHSFDFLSFLYSYSYDCFDLTDEAWLFMCRLSREPQYFWGFYSFSFLTDCEYLWLTWAVKFCYFRTGYLSIKSFHSKQFQSIDVIFCSESLLAPNFIQSKHFSSVLHTSLGSWASILIQNNELDSTLWSLKC